MITDTDRDSEDDDDRWELTDVVTGEANSAERSTKKFTFIERGSVGSGSGHIFVRRQMVRCRAAPGGSEVLWPPPLVIHLIPRRIAYFHPHPASLPSARRVESAMLLAVAGHS